MPSAGRGDAGADALPGEASIVDRRSGPDTASDRDALITLVGAVSDSSGKVIADRGVSVLDGAGHMQAAITDASGRFTMPGVATPYDLVVAAPAANSSVAYVGLTTATPTLWAYPTSSLAHTTYGADLSITISLPNCGGDCTLLLATSVNGTGGGAYSSISLASSTSYTQTLGFSWVGSTTATGQVNVLVANSALSSFWYTAISADLTDGGSSTSGAIKLPPVDTAGTLTLTSDEDGSFLGWSSPTLSISLNFPGGASTSLAALETSTLSAGIPDLVGATVSVAAIASLTEDGGVSGLDSLVEHRNLPLTTTSEVLKLYSPASWTTPSSTGGGDLPLRSTLQWALPTGTPGGFDLVDVGAGGTGCLVLSATKEVSLTSLVKLGVPLSPGAYSLLLEELRPGPSLDSVVGDGKLAALLDDEDTAISAQISSISGTLSP
jgi:hypothetical protein